MAENAFSVLQAGLETVNGTAVPADTILLATHPEITSDRTNEIIEENIGVRAKGVRAREGDVIGVSDTLTFDNAYYQILPLLFSCGMKGGITPTLQTSGQGDYLWAFGPSMTASNSIDSMTLELGDDVDYIEREYVMFEGYRIQFDIPQERGSAPVSVEGQYFSRQNTKTTKTAALTIPATENIVSKNFRFYRDTSWAGIGGTEIANILRGADIQLFTGVHAKWFGGADKTFDLHGEGLIDFTANFILEGNAAADDIYDLAQASTKSFVRLEVIGSQIGTGVFHKLSLDLGGVWTDPVKIAGHDRGNNLFRATLFGVHDITGAKVLDLNVITDVAAI